MLTASLSVNSPLLAASLLAYTLTTPGVHLAYTWKDAPKRDPQTGSPQVPPERDPKRRFPKGITKRASPKGIPKESQNHQNGFQKPSQKRAPKKHRQIIIFSTPECGSSVVNRSKIDEFQLLILAPYWLSVWTCLGSRNASQGHQKAI